MTPKGTRPDEKARRSHPLDPDRDDSVLADGEPDLLGEIRRALRSDQPLDLLAPISTLLSVIDPRDRNPFAPEPDIEIPTMDEMVTSFAAIPGVETTALLAMLAGLAPDEVARRRAERLLGRRHDPLPAWLAGLGRAETAATNEVVHVLGDAEDVMVEVRLAGGDVLTAVVHIDHNLGSVVRDAFVVPDRLDVLGRLLGESMDRHMEIRRVDPADARARVTEAIARGAMTVPPYESDTWPMCRPVVEWMVRLLPEGGRSHERPEWSEDETAILAEDFLASSLGRPFDDTDHRDLLDSILWFATGYGPGDPLRWSPGSVEILLLDWIPRKIAASRSFLAQVPALLRDFVRYCHARRSIPEDLTEETVGMVDLLEQDYLEAIGSPRLQGPLAVLAAAGAYDPGDGDDGRFDPFDSADFARMALDSLAEDVGGTKALDALDDAPLPDEELAWDGIPDDLAARVAEILALCDECCDALLDEEARTASRRLLAALARRGPEGIRRPGRAETAAAAVCWIVARDNLLLGGSTGQVYAKDLMAHFGLTGSPSGRAGSLLRAAGLERAFLGAEVDMLVSSRRHRILEQRQRLLSLLEDEAADPEPAGLRLAPSPEPQDDGPGAAGGSPGEGDADSGRPRLFSVPRVEKDTSPATGDGPHRHRLKVTIDGTRPPVWRRIEVPSTMTLAELHDVVQVAFGWEDANLHHFEIGRTRYGVDDGMGWGDPPVDEASAVLADVAPAGSRFTYTYDFGDNWEHRIVVEAVEPVTPTEVLPRCTGGRRAGPPEDVGGVWGYERLVEAMADPGHPERDELLDWLGGPFDPTAFDAAVVTRALRAQGRRR